MMRIVFLLKKFGGCNVTVPVNSMRTLNEIPGNLPDPVWDFDTHENTPVGDGFPVNRIIHEVIACRPYSDFPLSGSLNTPQTHRYRNMRSSAGIREPRDAGVSFFPL
jgi:hypothetical protein